MKKVISLFVALSCSACSTVRQENLVRQEDLLSWQNVDIIELEMHPLFSTFSLQKNILSDGSTLYVYNNTGSTVCVTNKSGITVCSNITCSNQFLVRDKKVLAYRVVGHCYTDCSVRSLSRPCAQSQAIEDARPTRKNVSDEDEWI